MLNGRQGGTARASAEGSGASADASGESADPDPDAEPAHAVIARPGFSARSTPNGAPGKSGAWNSGHSTHAPGIPVTTRPEFRAHGIPGARNSGHDAPGNPVTDRKSGHSAPGIPVTLARAQDSFSSLPSKDNTKLTTTTILESKGSGVSSSSSDLDLSGIGEADANTLRTAFADKAGPLSLRWVLSTYPTEQILAALAVLRVMEPGEPNPGRLRSAIEDRWTFANNPVVWFLRDQCGVSLPNVAEEIARRFSYDTVKHIADGKRKDIAARRNPPTPEQAAGWIISEIRVKGPAYEAGALARKQNAERLKASQEAARAAKVGQTRSLLDSHEQARSERANVEAEFAAIDPHRLLAAAEEVLAEMPHIAAKPHRNDIQREPLARACSHRFIADRIRAKLAQIASGEPRKTPLEESA